MKSLTIEPIALKVLDYTGPSMNPIFKSGDRLRILPYDGKKIRRGDVIAFVPPGGDYKIIHRVVSVDSRGIKTRGDNCNQVDQWVLDPEQILGRVTHARRRNSQRRIFGGLLGRLFAAKVKVIRAIDSPVSYLLRPAYNELAKMGVFTRLLPAKMRPRVVSFHRAAGTELQLLMGRHVIGRWLPGQSGWRIRRPFRLFVDETSLPQNPGKAAVVPPEADQLSVVDES